MKTKFILSTYLKECIVYIDCHRFIYAIRNIKYLFLPYYLLMFTFAFSFHIYYYKNAVKYIQSTTK